MAEKQGDRQGLSAKTLLVAIPLAAAGCCAAVYSLVILLATKLSSDWFPFAASIPFLILLFFLNPLLRLLNRRWALNRNELLLVFMILFIAVQMSAEGFAVTFLSGMTGPFYFANEANQWREKILQHMPLWLYPQPFEALDWFWRGLPPGQGLPWASWVSPLAHWAILIAAIHGIMIALTAIFRKQWIEHERLVFPLMEAPEALTSGYAAGRTLPDFMRAPLFWIGVALPVIVFGTVILHKLYPNVPQLLILGKDVVRNLRPSENWYNLRLHLLPAVLAFGYFVNRDVLLSIWVFGLLLYIEKNLMKMLGYSPGAFLLSENENPALLWQTFGGLAVYVLAGIYMARNHLKNVLRKAVRGAPEIDDSGEILRYRPATCLFLASFATAWLFLLKTGMTPGIAAALLGFMILFLLGVTRFVIEGGLALAAPPVSALTAVAVCFGLGKVSDQCLGALAASAVWVTSLSAGFMPSFANCLKLAEGKPFRRGTVLRAAILGIVLGAVVSVGALIVIGYEFGMLNSRGVAMRQYGKSVSQTLLYTRANTPGPDTTRLGWAAAGAGLTGTLVAARYAFPWWPIHPMGFAVAATFGSQISLFPFFLAWLIKGFLLRIGGVPLYERGKPFFYGLLVGHITIVAIGLAIDVFHIPPGVNLYI